MTVNEMMEAISEVLSAANLKKEYPEDRKEKAWQAFGKLCSMMNWKPDRTIILQDDGTSRETYKY